MHARPPCNELVRMILWPSYETWVKPGDIAVPELEQVPGGLVQLHGGGGIERWIRSSPLTSAAAGRPPVLIEDSSADSLRPVGKPLATMPLRALASFAVRLPLRAGPGDLAARPAPMTIASYRPRALMETISNRRGGHCRF